MGRRPGAPVRRLTIDTARVDAGRWPYTLPVVDHLVRHGLDLDPGVTIFTGANGAGKSTVIEAIAAVWTRRITAFRADFAQRALSEPSPEDSDLHDALRLDYTAGGATGGLFLRAERLHALAPSLTPASGRGRWAQRLAGPLLSRSHGEGFLELLTGMTSEPGLYVLDEPESALSFDSSLVLLSLMETMRKAGSQILLATHSPILAALPSATILQLGADGITRISYDDSDLATSWRSFLNSPDRYLSHLF